MKLIKIIFICLGILSISISLYTSTLIYPYRVASIVFFIFGFSILLIYFNFKYNLKSKGISLLEQGKFCQAIPFFNKTLEIDPDDKMAQLIKGYTLILMGELEKGKIFYDKVKEESPYSHDILYARGWIHYNNKEYDEAIKCFEEAIKLAPEFGRAYYNMACMFSLKKDADRAIQLLKKATEMSKAVYISDAINDKDFDNIRDKTEFIDLINYKS